MKVRRRPYWRDCLVVSLAVGVVGVTFGVFADAAGFDLAQIVVMSAFVFTGASQFAAVGVIDDGGSGGAAVGSALLLAVRNALYGPVARRALPAMALGRLGSAHFVIDETTAMAAAQADRRDARGAFWLTATTLWLCWNSGSDRRSAARSGAGRARNLGTRCGLPGDVRRIAGTSCAHRCGVGPPPESRRQWPWAQCRSPPRASRSCWPCRPCFQRYSCSDAATRPAQAPTEPEASPGWHRELAAAHTAGGWVLRPQGVGRDRAG